MMMKADVLSGFKEVKVCTAYKYRNEEISHLPFNIEQENVRPVYTSFPGWKKDLTRLTKKEELPKTLLEYIDFLEKSLGVPIRIVSVGPDRKQTIMR
jgi:adenylosuccinate synthase